MFDFSLNKEVFDDLVFDFTAAIIELCLPYIYLYVYF